MTPAACAQAAWQSMLGAVRGAGGGLGIGGGRGASGALKGAATAAIPRCNLLCVQLQMAKIAQHAIDAIPDTGTTR